MYFVIGEECILCDLCAHMCPKQAISRSGDRNRIDQEKCIQCGRCYDNCPVEAIAKEK